MVPSPFTYKKVSTAQEAINLLVEHDGDAKILAGGHSLIPAMKLRLSSPDVLIDISKIEDLSYIRKEAGYIAIGACTTHDQIAHSDILQQHLPILPESADLIGDMQVRNKGTIGGALAHADPAADYPAILYVCDASIVIHGPTGERILPVKDFFKGLFYTDLAENELVTEIRFPLINGTFGSSYQKFMQSASRYAIVGCAVMLMAKDAHSTCDKISVSFNSVSSTAFRDTKVEQALEGKTLSDENIHAAAQHAAEEVDILNDNFASLAYRKHLAKVLAERAIKEAVARL